MQTYVRSAVSSARCRRSRLVLWAVVIVALGLVSEGIAQQTTGSTGTQEVSSGHATGSVAGRSIGLDPVLHGLALPTLQVTMSAPIEGVLMTVMGDEGRRVNRGDILAQMDNRVAAAAVQMARRRAESVAGAAQAKAAYKLADLQFKAVAKAHAAQASSPFELNEAGFSRDQAKAAFRMAIDTREIAHAALELEQEKLELHNVRAPFDGRVIRIFVQPGATLTTASPLLEIVSLDSLEAQMHLPLDLYGKLRAGQTYELMAQEPVSRSLQGRLKTIDPVIDPSSRTFRCVFVIDNADGSLPAGFALRLPVEQLTQVQAQSGEQVQTQPVEQVQAPPAESEPRLTAQQALDSVWHRAGVPQGR
jgi:RND family efflux transporter MFP subunit